MLCAWVDMQSRGTRLCRRSLCFTEGAARLAVRMHELTRPFRLRHRVEVYNNGQCCLQATRTSAWVTTCGQRRSSDTDVPGVRVATTTW